MRLQTDSELSIAQFRPTAVEEASLKVLQEDLFKCITLRSFSPPQIFPSLVSLLNCVKRQTYDKEVSNIEVVSEKADSKPTLVGVIARLHKLFLIDHGTEACVPSYASRRSRTRDTVKLTVCVCVCLCVCVSVPAVTAQRLQCDEN